VVIGTCDCLPWYLVLCLGVLVTSQKGRRACLLGNMMGCLGVVVRKTNEGILPCRYRFHAFGGIMLLYKYESVIHLSPTSSVKLLHPRRCPHSSPSLGSPPVSLE
jgi:hypothetical protein